MSRQGSALSSATKQTMSPEFGSGEQCVLILGSLCPPRCMREADFFCIYFLMRHAEKAESKLQYEISGVAALKLPVDAQI